MHSSRTMTSAGSSLCGYSRMETDAGANGAVEGAGGTSVMASPISADGPRPGMSGRSRAVAQPGGRSLTAGTALRARSPVARQPAAAASRPAAIGEAEGSLLGDRRRPLDLHPVDVVLGAAGPVRRGVRAHPVDVLQADAGLALVHAVDGEVDGRHLPRVDDALGGRDRGVGDPLVPRGRDLVELDAGGVTPSSARWHPTT